jgi:hypothetical protein
MARKHRTARGKMINMDAIRLANEEVIAVGNLRVNARGDQLGKGGKVIKTRSQVMKSVYKKPTKAAVDDLAPPKKSDQPKAPAKKEVKEETVSLSKAAKPKTRGKLASDVLSNKDDNV